MSNGRRQAGAARASPSETAAVNALLDTAGAYYAAGRLDEAEALYARVEARHAGDIRAVYSLAVIDIRGSRFAAARSRLRAIARDHPEHFHAWHNLGVSCQALGRWGEAASAYDAALALRPEATETAFSCAIVLAIDGRIAEAVALYRRLAADPAQRGRALSRLAILEPQAVTDAECAALIDEARSGPAALAAHFALGDVLDARGDADGAFAHYSAGSATKRGDLESGDPAARPEAVEADLERSAALVEAVFTPAFIAGHARGVASGAAPIFIVGFPRCGSSLVEQILASHPGAQGMGEIGAVSAAADAWFPYRTGQAPEPGSPRRVAEAYLSALRAAGWSPGKRPIDKSLENHVHIGLIALMFPGATILDCVRDPVDTCLSTYRQLFARGAETLYDLASIGRAFVRYRTVMEHWGEVLPGAVTQVCYETIVADPDEAIRHLVTQACGLPWSPRCLEFHKTRRGVATASAAQVRRPIHGKGVGRWRRYEAHLAPLLTALGPYAPDSD